MNVIPDQHHQPLLPVPCGALNIAPDTTSSQSSSDSLNEVKLQKTVYFSLVIPTYNESKNIEKIIALLTELLDESLPSDYELIVVDDNSPDRTWEIAQTFTSQYPQLRVMRREQERGLATAVIRGWQAAQGTVLGVIDGDLQHPPEMLLQLLAAINKGADLAVASRHVEGGGVSSWSIARRILSRGAQILGLIVLPRVVGRVTDPMSGYFLVRRSAIANQKMSPLGYKILIEVVGRGQIETIAEVGYVFREREQGESKVTRKQYIDYLQHLLRLRLSTGRVGKIRRKVDFPIGRLLRFGLVGLSGVVVDMAGLYLLHSVWGFGLTRSAILAAELAIINNFFWNDSWTFRDLSERQQQGRQMLKRFIKFNIICFMGLILKVLLLNFLFNVLLINPYLANFLAIAVVTVWNFWLNLKLNWRVTEVK